MDKGIHNQNCQYSLRKQWEVPMADHLKIFFRKKLTRKLEKNQSSTCAWTVRSSRSRGFLERGEIEYIYTASLCRWNKQGWRTLSVFHHSLKPLRFFEPCFPFPSFSVFFILVKDSGKENEVWSKNKRKLLVIYLIRKVGKHFIADVRALGISDFGKTIQEINT